MSAYQIMREIGPDKVYVITDVCEDWDDMGWRAPRVTTEHKTALEIFKDVVGEVKGIAHDIKDEKSLIGTWRDLFGDHECGACYIQSLQDWREEEADKTRRRLEDAAQALLKDSGAGRIDSIQFLDYVQSLIDNANAEYEHWNGGENQMEQWAAHRFAGGGVETFYSDNDYVNSRINERYNHAAEILQWVADQCPMLWARWQDSRGRD